MSGGGGNIPTYGAGYSPVPKEGTGSWDWPPPGTNPTTPGDPSVTAPTQPYNAQSPYTTPTFGYTPYSPYSGLSQQIKAAMNPTLFGYAAPRTGISDMAYAPWSMLYGGPSQVPFPGSLPPGAPPPPPGTTTPLPGTGAPGGIPAAGTGTSGQGGIGGAGTQTGTGVPPGGGTMGSNLPMSVPGGAPGAPPAGGPPAPRVPGVADPKSLATDPPIRRHRTAGFNAGLGLRDTTQDTQPYSGIDWGGGNDAPGGLLRAMQDGGLDVTQTGMARLLMSAGRQGQFGGTLSNDQLVAATRQGVPADLMAQGSFKNGQWLDGSGNLMRGRGNQFNYHKRK